MHALSKLIQFMIANPNHCCRPQYHPETLFPTPDSPEHKPHPIYSTPQASAGRARAMDLEQGAEWSWWWSSYLPWPFPQPAYIRKSFSRFGLQPRSKVRDKPGARSWSLWCYGPCTSYRQWIKYDRPRDSHKLRTLLRISEPHLQGTVQGSDPLG